MYSKLPVSSLESRALNNDAKAVEELHTRANAGLKRARLALERIALKINRPKQVKPQVNRPEQPNQTNTCAHIHYDWDCPCCLKQWDDGLQEILRTEDKSEPRLEY